MNKIIPKFKWLIVALLCGALLVDPVQKSRAALPAVYVAVATLLVLGIGYMVIVWVYKSDLQSTRTTDDFSLPLQTNGVVTVPVETTNSFSVGEYIVIDVRAHGVITALSPFTMNVMFGFFTNDFAPGTVIPAGSVVSPDPFQYGSRACSSYSVGDYTDVSCTVQIWGEWWFSDDESVYGNDEGIIQYGYIGAAALHAAPAPAEQALVVNNSAPFLVQYGYDYAHNLPWIAPGTNNPGWSVLANYQSASNTASLVTPAGNVSVVLNTNTDPNEVDQYNFYGAGGTLTTTNTCGDQIQINLSSQFMTGAPTNTEVVYRSTDLQNWTALTTNLIAPGQTLTVTDSLGSVHAFYRAAFLP
jgi:hypothetical protein